MSITLHTADKQIIPVKFWGFPGGERGVRIGNLTEYQSSTYPCAPTDRRASVAIESYWLTGNCIFGKLSPTEVTDVTGFTLKDNTKYHVDITVDNFYHKIEYRIAELDDDRNEVSAFRAEVVDPFWNNSDPSHNGWWIAEVFSNHNWVIVLENVTWW